MVLIKTRHKVTFRASSIGKLMIGGKVWTESDQIKLDEYKQREAGKFLSAAGNPLPLSDKMKKDMAALIAKKNAPFELGETAKSHIREIWMYNNFGYRENVVTKYMLKGQLCEQDSIALVDEVFPIPHFRIKNTRRFSNDIVSGEPDIDLSKEMSTIEDIKSSWSLKTFLDVKTYPEEYHGQGQAYMDLTGARKFSLYYCLVDTPEELIIEEDKRLYWKFGGNENNPHYIEMSEQLYKNHHYSQIPANLRVKRFEFEYDPEYIKELRNRVEYARDYYDSLTLNDVMQ